MGYLVKHLSLIRNRWKYRKGIPARLRPYIDGRITEFVRWIGRHEGTGKNPPPSVLSRYAEVDRECSALITMAEKRAAGHFDELNPEVIAHLIAQARHELLDEDDEGRFSTEGEELFLSLRDQVGDRGGSNPDPDRKWNKRQESLDCVLPALRDD